MKVLAWIGTVLLAFVGLVFLLGLLSPRPGPGLDSAGKRAGDERDCVYWVAGKASEEEARWPMSDAERSKLIRVLGTACMRAKGY